MKKERNAVTELGIDMDVEVFAAVIRYTGLSLPAERTEELLPAAIDTLTLVRQVSRVALGETAPATAFNASWE